jgi:hypothetical protein
MPMEDQAIRKNHQHATTEKFPQPRNAFRPSAAGPPPPATKAGEQNQPRAVAYAF